MSAMPSNFTVQFNAVSYGVVDFVVASAVTGFLTPEQAGAIDGKVYAYVAKTPDGLTWEFGSGTYSYATHTLKRTTISTTSTGVITAPVNFAVIPIVTLFPAPQTTLEPASGSAGTATPLVDGTAAVGTSTKWAHEDHVHPTDTTRAPLVSPALTGTPTAPTAAAGDNSAAIASTAFVGRAIARKALASSIDFNTVVSPGKYNTIDLTSSNAPEANKDWYVDVDAFTNDATYVVQVATSLNTSMVSRYIREKVGISGWQPWHRIVLDNDALNVKAFGAIGDGSTDDTNAFQLALAAATYVTPLAVTGAPGAGAVIEIPAGTYRINSKLSSKVSNLTFRGSGANRTVLKLAAGSALSDYILEFAAVDAGTYVQNLRVSGFSIDLQGSTSAMGIHLGTLADGCSVKDVWVYNFKNTALQIDSNQAGLLYISSGLRVENLYVVPMNATTVPAVILDSIQQVTFDCCKFYGNADTGTTRSQTTGVVLRGNSAATVFTNCSFASWGATNSTAQFGLDVQYNATSGYAPRWCSLIDCTFEYCSSGLRLNGTSAHPVQYFDVCRSTSFMTIDSGGYAVLLDYASNCLINAAIMLSCVMTVNSAQNQVITSQYVVNGYSDSGTGNVFTTYNSTGEYRQQAKGTVVNGATSGNVTIYQVLSGTVKKVVMVFNSFVNNSGSQQVVNYPVQFTTTGMAVATGNSSGLTVTAGFTGLVISSSTTSGSGVVIIEGV